ncbi:hypothetical protein [Kingella potus]|nr:hypothetical protein [Kingella potus]
MGVGRAVCSRSLHLSEILGTRARLRHTPYLSGKGRLKTKSGFSDGLSVFPRRTV